MLHMGKKMFPFAGNYQLGEELQLLDVGSTNCLPYPTKLKICCFSQAVPTAYNIQLNYIFPACHMQYQMPIISN